MKGKEDSGVFWHQPKDNWTLSLLHVVPLFHPSGWKKKNRHKSHVFYRIWKPSQRTAVQCYEVSLLSTDLGNWEEAPASLRMQVAKGNVPCPNVTVID